MKQIRYKRRSLILNNKNTLYIRNCRGCLPLQHINRKEEKHFVVNLLRFVSDRYIFTKIVLNNDQF